MTQDDDALDLLAIRNATFVRELRYFPQLDSTNSKAVQLAKDGCETPALVITDLQTAGRGRGSNPWWATRGALTFTVVIDFPMLTADRLAGFSLTTGLAVCQTLERFAPDADLALKWPNDVYWNGKKAAGILIERPRVNEPCLAVGIGINVNNSTQQAPAGVADVATSLRDELNTQVSRVGVLIECLQQLEKRIDDHIHRPAALLDQWRAYCLLTGKHVRLEGNNASTSGVCRGIDADGALLVDDGASLQRCIAGSVVAWKITG